MNYIFIKFFTIIMFNKEKLKDACKIYNVCKFYFNTESK